MQPGFKGLFLCFKISLFIILIPYAKSVSKTVRWLSPSLLTQTSDVAFVRTDVLWQRLWRRSKAPHWCTITVYVNSILLLSQRVQSAISTFLVCIKKRAIGSNSNLTSVWSRAYPSPPSPFQHSVGQMLFFNFVHILNDSNTISE